MLARVASFTYNAVTLPTASAAMLQEIRHIVFDYCDIHTLSLCAQDAALFDNYMAPQSISVLSQLILSWEELHTTKPDLTDVNVFKKFAYDRVQLSTLVLELEQLDTPRASQKWILRLKSAKAAMGLCWYDYILTCHSNRSSEYVCGYVKYLAACSSNEPMLQEKLFEYAQQCRHREDIEIVALLASQSRNNHHLRERIYQWLLMLKNLNDNSYLVVLGGLLYEPVFLQDQTGIHCGKEFLFEALVLPKLQDKNEFKLNLHLFLPPLMSMFIAPFLPSLPVGYDNSFGGSASLLFCSTNSISHCVLRYYSKAFPSRTAQDQVFLSNLIRLYFDEISTPMKAELETKNDHSGLYFLKRGEVGILAGAARVLDKANKSLCSKLLQRIEGYLNQPYFSQLLYPSAIRLAFEQESFDKSAWDFLVANQNPYPLRAPNAPFELSEQFVSCRDLLCSVNRPSLIYNKAFELLSMYSDSELEQIKVNFEIESVANQTSVLLCENKLVSLATIVAVTSVTTTLTALIFGTKRLRFGTNSATLYTYAAVIGFVNGIVSYNRYSLYKGLLKATYRASKLEPFLIDTSFSTNSSLVSIKRLIIVALAEQSHYLTAHKRAQLLSIIQSVPPSDHARRSLSLASLAQSSLLLDSYSFQWQLLTEISDRTIYTFVERGYMLESFVSNASLLSVKMCEFVWHCIDSFPSTTHKLCILSKLAARL